MLRQPVSSAILEFPLLRDLDLDHILELHYSSLHHTKMQVRSIKSDSSFKKTYYLTTSQESGKIFFLGCMQRHTGLHPSKPVDHTISQTEGETQGDISLSGASCPI